MAPIAHDDGGGPPHSSISARWSLCKIIVSIVHASLLPIIEPGTDYLNLFGSFETPAQAAHVLPTLDGTLLPAFERWRS